MTFNLSKSNQLYDVIVIGGGFAGSFTALELVKQGYKVLHIEKDSSILDTNSSSFNECYKLHTGVHYLGDLETATQCLLGSIEFAKEFSEFIEGKPNDPWRKGRHYVMSNSLYGHKEVCETLQKLYEQKVNEDPDNKVFGEPEHFIKYLEKKDYLYIADKIPFTNEPYSIDVTYEVIPKDTDVKTHKIYVYLEKDQIYCKAINQDEIVETIKIESENIEEELKLIKNVLRSKGSIELTNEQKKIIFSQIEKSNPLYSQQGSTQDIFVKTAIETPESQINLKKLKNYLQNEFKKHSDKYTFLPNHEVKHISFEEGSLNYVVETQTRKYKRIIILNTWDNIDKRVDSYIYCIRDGNNIRLLFQVEQNWEEKEFILNDSWPKELKTSETFSEFIGGGLIDQVTKLCNITNIKNTEQYTGKGIANCAWHKIEELNRQLGYVANDETTINAPNGKMQNIRSERIIRQKISLLVTLPDALKNVNTGIFSCGPHMSFTNLGDGTGIITYEVVTNAGAYRAGTLILPEEIQSLYNERLLPTHGKGKEFAKRIMEGARRYKPELGHSDCKVLEVRLGHVKMFVKNGKSFSLNDKNSAIHGRQEDGVEQNDLCFVSHSGMKMTFTKKSAVKVAEIFRTHFYIRDALLSRRTKALKPTQQIINILRKQFYTKEELVLLANNELSQEVIQNKETKIKKFYDVLLFNILRDLSINTTGKICEKTLSINDQSEADTEQINELTKKSIIDMVNKKSALREELNVFSKNLHEKPLSSLLSKSDGPASPIPKKKLFCAAKFF